MKIPMKTPHNLPAIVLAVLLAACLLAYYFTRDLAMPFAAQQKSTAAARPLVDRSLLTTAIQLTPSAATAEEQAQAREAWRLADHELDLAFDAALRQAEAEAGAELATNVRLRQLSDNIARLEDRVNADKKRVDDLGKDSNNTLDAQAQLDLDQTELDDAKEDLEREGGEKRARLQSLLQQHEASDKEADQNMKFGTPRATGTLLEQLNEWFSLGGYQQRLQAARQQASDHDLQMNREHKTLAAQLGSQPAASASPAVLRQLSEKRKTLTGYDQRDQDAKQLVNVYQSWSALIAAHQRAVLRQALASFAAIIALLLIALLLNRLTYGSVDRERFHPFRKRIEQALGTRERVIARIVLLVVAVLAIVIILFGAPTQLSALIGLVTAGLTVALKDFIVAFFGWFNLVGKNGIRVGDWVEIEGVSGEVIEIRLFKTLLLELGNWTETGHPTGRRVAFSNSFAFEGHYFNFSTSDQWLWDELQLPLPSAGDPYEMVRQIRNIVEHATEADAAAAGKEWERVTRKYGAREFSAAPAVNLRPSATGLEVVVRYITRAPRRNIVKAQLFQSLVDLLHKPTSAETAAGHIWPSP
jgi:small-conductance mechanosensitive channel